jgi:hypothetical protein
LRGRRTQLDKAKGDQPENAAPTAVGEFRRRGSRRRDGGIGPGTRRRDGGRRSCLLRRRRGSRRGGGSRLTARRPRGSGGRARRGRGRRRRARGRRGRRARRSGSLRGRGKARVRGVRISGPRPGRACSRGAGRAGLQTVPQEFVALVHGLLGCGLPAADRRHWSSTGPVSVQYRLPCRLRLLLTSCKLSAASLRCAAAFSAISAVRQWTIAAALLPRLIASHGAGAAVVWGQSEGGSEWLIGAAANWCKRLMWRAVRRADPRWADDR